MGGLARSPTLRSVVRRGMDCRHTAFRRPHHGARGRLRRRRLSVGVLDLGDLARGHYVRLPSVLRRTQGGRRAKDGAYPPPVYPLLAGGLACSHPLGSSYPFPSHAELGNGCASAPGHVPLVHPFGRRWFRPSGSATSPGSRSWAERSLCSAACKRGRRRWEPFTVIVLACLPPVWSCVGNVFHPQDLIAMGLILGSIACVRRDAWIWSGVLVALAVLSQQYALLVAVPVLVVAPRAAPTEICSRSDWSGCSDGGSDRRDHIRSCHAGHHARDRRLPWFWGDSPVGAPSSWSHPRLGDTDPANCGIGMHRLLVRTPSGAGGAGPSPPDVSRRPRSQHAPRLRAESSARLLHDGAQRRALLLDVVSGRVRTMSSLG